MKLERDTWLLLCSQIDADTKAKNRFEMDGVTGIRRRRVDEVGNAGSMEIIKSAQSFIITFAYPPLAMHEPILVKFVRLRVLCRGMCDDMTFTLGPSREHVTGQCSAKMQLAALVTRA